MNKETENKELFDLKDKLDNINYTIEKIESIVTLLTDMDYTQDIVNSEMEDTIKLFELKRIHKETEIMLDVIMDYLHQIKR